jgi:hypothetical protein
MYAPLFGPLVSGIEDDGDGYPGLSFPPKI